MLKARRARARGEDDAALLLDALAVLGPDEAGAAGDVEACIDTLLGQPSRRLAAYGTLRPGERHHDVVAGVGGLWTAGTTTGELTTKAGYPVLDWSAGGGPVPLDVLRSDELPAHWSEIDEFEGSGYVRAYVPVELAGKLVVASCYLEAP